jgi:RNA polymerase sigma-70 factor (ECF subfamily)
MNTTTYNLSAGKPLEPVMNETTLVRLAQQGDREMFSHLYEAYVSRIYRYVYFRVPDEALAEDITSQVFLKVWEKLNTYQAGQSPFMAWIYRIAHNTVIDYYRTRKAAISIEDAREVELSHYDDVDEKLDSQLQSQELRAAMDGLTKDQQQVLLMKFVGGMSTTEIARKLCKQEGAVRALQMRGLQGLSKCAALQKSQRRVGSSSRIMA